MASLTLEQLLPEYERIRLTSIKGPSKFNVYTYTPNSANPSEDFYVTIPTTRENVCIVPNSIFLSVKFKNKNTKSHFLNNIGKLLVNKMVVTIDGNVAYDNMCENVLSVYKDLWLTAKERANMISEGIMNENLRKLMSGDDTAVTTAGPDKTLFEIFDGRVRIKLGRILNNHGLFAPYGMNTNIRYKITFPPADHIMKAASSGQSLGYSLEEIELEYQTIESPEVYARALSSYETGRSLSYNNIVMMKKLVWGKNTTIINETINVPRKSMRNIVLLFKEAGTKNSESYVFPNIEKVNVSIEGVPNCLYSKGLLKDRFFHEAKKVFLDNTQDESLTAADFYDDDKFALVIDLRTFDDNTVAGNGTKILNTQSGVLLEITKKPTLKDVTCYVFVASDGMVNIVNKTLQSISY